MISHRQTKHEFAGWVSRRPDGFARFAWSAALRVAGERLWDRNWSKIASLVGPLGEAGLLPPRRRSPSEGGSHSASLQRSPAKRQSIAW